VGIVRFHDVIESEKKLETVIKELTGAIF